MYFNSEKKKDNIIKIILVKNCIKNTKYKRIKVIGSTSRFNHL